MCIYMYIYIYVYIYIYTPYICIHIHILHQMFNKPDLKFTFKYILVNTYACIYIYLYFTYMYIYVYMTPGVPQARFEIHVQLCIC